MTEQERKEHEAEASATTAESDTTADAGTGQEPAALPPAQAADSAQSGGKSLLPVVALVVALLAMVGAFLVWQKLGERLERFTSAQVTVDAALVAAQERIAAFDAEVEKRFDAHALQLAEQGAALERQRELAEQTYQALREEVGQDRNRWVVAEIEYLMRVAAHRLALAGDVAAAVAALQTADARLHDLADPAWLGVRERVADEIAALRAVPRIDIEGLALSLRSLARRSETLPVLGARYRAGDPRATGGEASADGARGDSWREALDIAWREVRQLVEVRRNDQPVEPMLAPELEYFLYQNLRLQLDAARLALLRGEAPLYLESLRSARDWAATYFDQEHASTQAMLAELDRLLEVDIAPPLPDLGEALRELRATPAYREARDGNAS
jgi:uroporphyrin-3 C-methyltransferase